MAAVRSETETKTDTDTETYPESGWLFDELKPEAPIAKERSPSKKRRGRTTADPLRQAQKLARKMPYLKRGHGERDRAGRAICQLLLASLDAPGQRVKTPH